MRRTVDLLDLLILALRLLIVALLYLFLVAVLRAAVGALGVSPAPVPVRSSRRETQPRLRLAVLEPGASDFEAGQVLDVSEGATFGRTRLASVVLSDTTVSAEHARLERAGRAWVVTDLDSTNGTRINDVPVRPNAPTPLAEGDVLSLGAIRLQVLSH